MAACRLALGALLLTCLLSAPLSAHAKCWIGVDYSVNTLSKAAKMDVPTSLNILLKDDPGGIKVYGPDKRFFAALAGTPHCRLKAHPPSLNYSPECAPSNQIPGTQATVTLGITPYPTTASFHPG